MAGQRCLCRRTVLQGLLGLGLAACGDRLRSPDRSPTRSAPPLTIAAAASLQDSLRAIVAEIPTLPPATFTFGGSGALQQQIAQGAPVDLLITASPKPLDQLEAEGLLWPSGRFDLLSNTLVLVVPSSTAAELALPEVVAPDRAVSQDGQGFAAIDRVLTENPQLRVAVGNPALVPAGEYGVEVLRFLGLYGRWEPQIVWTKDVRQVLAYVETGDVVAGLVYGTDARLRGTVRQVAVAPAGSHRPIVYPGAVLRSSRQATAALVFLTQLTQPPAQAIFQRYGFLPLPDAGYTKSD
ncbi:MAG: molybdate ABC transporter substrate-binding protein [Prochlorothrix sp.]|nr:molybdate ABC transporter substrate-binding protein [Prochlorothrix sp.]